jgi:hypothetical protein
MTEPSVRSDGETVRLVSHFVTFESRFPIRRASGNLAASCLDGRETWFLTSSEEHGLRMSENRTLMRK